MFLSEEIFNYSRAYLKKQKKGEEIRGRNRFRKGDIQMYHTTVVSKCLQGFSIKYNQPTISKHNWKTSINFLMAVALNSRS